jgi:hypothetical protein
MSEVMNTKRLLASVAIVAALALVGVVAVAAIEVLVVQEAFAAGCPPGHSGNGNAFFNSDKKCHKPGP